jgi:outer membrane immunogenic protein
MKIKLLVAAAATVMASSAMAQSAFQGFYGQIATGYENNSVSGLNLTASQPVGSQTWNASNQSFGGAPLVIGLGYNFSIAPKWLLGIGVDYSALSQKSSSFSTTIPGADGATLGGQTLEASNRYNIFVTPGYVIDKDKLVYLKAGYSGVTVKASSPSSYVDTDTGSAGSIPSGSQSKTLSGYVVGLGYKQIITGGFYGFAEANYMSYSKSTYSGTIGETNVSTNPSMSSYQALVGVGYRF